MLIEKEINPLAKIPPHFPKWFTIDFRLRSQKQSGLPTIGFDSAPLNLRFSDPSGQSLANGCMLYQLHLIKRAERSVKTINLSHRNRAAGTWWTVIGCEPSEEVREFQDAKLLGLADLFQTSEQFGRKYFLGLIGWRKNVLFMDPLSRS